MYAELITGLAETLKNATASKSFRRDIHVETYCPPEVFPFEMPPKKNDELSDFPYIVVMPDRCHDDQQIKEYDVRIGFGIYTAEKDVAAGWHDVINLGDTLRVAVREHELVIDKFRLVYPFDVRYGYEDDLSERWPYYDGEMFCKYEWGV